MLRFGGHATLAGVAVVLTIPVARAAAGQGQEATPLSRLEHGLHPWVAFLIVPMFGFANAGVPLDGFTPMDMVQSVPLGVMLGLFLGKQAGIFAAVWLLVRCGLASKPRDANWPQIYGVALLCGIGFTISLFIGGLAFGGGSHQNDAAKLGILLGSVASALAGFAVLRASAAPARADRD